jgi:hypothetical protein
MRLTVSLRRLAFWLIAILIALTAAGIVAEYARYYLPIGPDLPNYFSLTEEKNVPTWWSSFLLMACSVVLFAIAATKSRAAGEFRRHWIVLGAIFCYMSIDELVEIHEWLGSIPSLNPFGSVLYYGWVVPASVLVLLFAVSYLRFLFHLPMPTRVKVAAAGFIYVGGAVGVEILVGFWTTKHGELNFAWAMGGLVEEAMEMIGSSLFLYTLIEYLGRTAPDLSLAIRSGRD